MEAQSIQKHNAAWIHLLDICRQKQIAVGPMIHLTASGKKSQQASSMRRSIIREMVARGLPKTDIAAVFNIARETVHRMAVIIMLVTLFVWRITTLTPLLDVTTTSLIAWKGHARRHQSYALSILRKPYLPCNRDLTKQKSATANTQRAESKFLARVKARRAKGKRFNYYRYDKRTMEKPGVSESLLPETQKETGIAA